MYLRLINKKIISEHHNGIITMSFSRKFNRILKGIRDNTATSLVLSFDSEESERDNDKLFVELSKALRINISLIFIDFSFLQFGVGNECISSLCYMLKKNRPLLSLNLSWNIIDDNNAEIFARSLTENSKLTSLDVSNCSLGFKGINVFSDMLKINKTLTTLHLAENEMSLKETRVLCEGLSQNSRLTLLNLSNNKIGSSTAVVLSDMLSKNRSLFFLNLAGNQIGDAGIEVLGKSLVNNTTLISIDLTHNGISSNGVKLFFNLLKENETLTSCVLNINEIGDDGVIELTEWLRINRSPPTKLLLSRCKIGDKGAESLADWLKTDESLLELNLSRNLVHVDGCRAFANRLKTNSSLKLLDLGFNRIGSEGAEILSGLLIENRSLESLNLEVSGIGDKGVTPLAFALRKNRGIIYLNLRFNQIGPEGGIKLFEALAENCSIVSLNLHSNSMGDKGIIVLARTLVKNKTITSLNIYRNEMREKGAKALIEALKINTTITYINRQANSISKESKKEISYYIKRNKKLAENLLKAIRRGNLKIVIECCEQGASLTYQNKDGNTALHLALFEKRQEIISYFFTTPMLIGRVVLTQRNNIGETIDETTPFSRDLEKVYEDAKKAGQAWPREKIMEEDLVLMRTGQSWEKIKNRISLLDEYDRAAFIEWLYCGQPSKNMSLHELNKFRQSVIKTLKELNVQVTEGLYLFTKRKIADDLRNYVSQFKEQKEKNVYINVNGEKIGINRFVLTTRSDLYRCMFLSVQKDTDEVSDFSKSPLSFFKVFRSWVYDEEINTLTDEEIHEIQKFLIEGNFDVEGYYQLTENSFSEPIQTQLEEIKDNKSGQNQISILVPFGIFNQNETNQNQVEQEQHTESFPKGMSKKN